MKPRNDGVTTVRAPIFAYLLELEIDGKPIRLEWNSNTELNGTPSEPGEWERLHQFTHLLDAMIAANPAGSIRALRRGAYR